MKSATRFTILLVAVLAAGVVLTGCASRSGDAQAADVEGTWVAESFGGATSLTPVDPSVTSEITLKGGEATGNAGVNTFSGPYVATTKGVIDIGPLDVGKAKGAANAMKQETAFIAALDKAEHWELNQGKLVLGDLGNNTLVVLVKR